MSDPNANVEDLMVWRPVTMMPPGKGFQRDEKFDQLAISSVKRLKQYYDVERKPTGVFIPPEDKVNNQKTYSNHERPFLYSLTSPSGKFLSIPSDRSLIMFRNWPDFVYPFFTSEKRLTTFVNQIVECGGRFPEYKVIFLKPDAESQIQQMHKKNQVIVNPIPEFVLSSYLVMWIEDGLKIAAVEIREEDVLEDEGNNFLDFFKRRK